MQNTFGLEIYAANRQFFAGACPFPLIIPAEDGQKEFLADHANMICAIVPGELKFEDSEGKLGDSCSEFRVCEDDQQPCKTVLSER